MRRRDFLAGLTAGAAALRMHSRVEGAAPTQPTSGLAAPAFTPLALGAIVCLAFIDATPSGGDRLVLQRRTPLGVVRVTERTESARPLAKEMTVRRLVDGGKDRGSTVVAPPELRRYPTMYYHELGPVGRLMSATAWFTPPLPKGGDARNVEWLKHHQNHLHNDARIAASLVGAGAASGAASCAKAMADMVTAAIAVPPRAARRRMVRIIWGLPTVLLRFCRRCGSARPASCRTRRSCRRRCGRWRQS